jgi:soluble cytochrome b562
MSKEKEYSEEFVDESTDVDEFDLPDWWDEELDDESESISDEGNIEEEEISEKSIKDNVNTYEKWL